MWNVTSALQSTHTQFNDRLRLPATDGFVQALGGCVVCFREINETHVP